MRSDDFFYMSCGSWLFFCSDSSQMRLSDKRVVVLFSLAFFVFACRNSKTVITSFFDCSLSKTMENIPMMTIFQRKKPHPSLGWVLSKRGVR